MILRYMQLGNSNPELERHTAYHVQNFTDQVMQTVADAVEQDRPDLSVQVTVAVAVTIMTIAVRQVFDPPCQIGSEVVS